MGLIFTYYITKGYGNFIHNNKLGYIYSHICRKLHGNVS